MVRVGRAGRAFVGRFCLHSDIRAHARVGIGRHNVASRTGSPLGGWFGDARWSAVHGVRPLQAVIVRGCGTQGQGQASVRATRFGRVRAWRYDGGEVDVPVVARHRVAERRAHRVSVLTGSAAASPVIHVFRWAWAGERVNGSGIGRWDPRGEGGTEALCEPTSCCPRLSPHARRAAGPEGRIWRGGESSTATASQFTDTQHSVRRRIKEQQSDGGRRSRVLYQAGVLQLQHDDDVRWELGRFEETEAGGGIGSTGPPGDSAEDSGNPGIV